MKLHLLLLISIFFYGCGDNKTDSPQINTTATQETPKKNNNKTNISDNFVQSIDGNYIIEWKTQPEKLIVNQYFSIEFFIKEPMKSINYSVELLIDAGMQQHNHGMHTKPVVKRLDKQHFLSEGMLFHMAGEWQINLEISRGIVKEKAIIKVTL